LLLLLLLPFCFDAKADCTTTTTGLCTPGIEEVIVETTTEETSSDSTGITTITTTTSDITTTTITNQDSSNLLESGSDFVVTSKEGDMDSDWGGQGPASMPSGNSCYGLGSDKCAMITGSGNSTSTMGVAGMGTTFIQTIDISDLNVTHGGETNYTIKVDKQDPQDRIYLHVTGKHGTTQVFTGTDILSESGVTSGYQQYSGSFDFSGVLNTLVVEIGGRDINLAVGPLFDDVNINVLYNTINTIVTQQITTVEMFVALNTDVTEEIIDVVETIFEYNEPSNEEEFFSFEPIEEPIDDFTFESVEMEMQEFEMEFQMEMDMNIDMEYDMPSTLVMVSTDMEMEMPMEITVASVEMDIEMEMDFPDIDIPEPEPQQMEVNIEPTTEEPTMDMPETMEDKPTMETTMDNEPTEPEPKTVQEDVQEPEMEPESETTEPESKSEPEETKEETKETKTKPEQEPDPEEVEEEPEKPKKEIKKEPKKEPKKEIKKEPSAKQKAASKIVKKMGDKGRYETGNQIKTLIVMNILSNSKNFFDVQQNIPNIEGFFNNNTLPDTSISDNNIAGYVLFGGSDTTYNQMVDAQYK